MKITFKCTVGNSRERTTTSNLVLAHIIVPLSLLGIIEGNPYVSTYVHINVVQMYLIFAFNNHTGLVLYTYVCMSQSSNTKQLKLLN